jgi:hypothetical protein
VSQGFVAPLPALRAALDFTRLFCDFIILGEKLIWGAKILRTLFAYTAKINN